MNVDYINPFLGALENVFETMIGRPLDIGKPGLRGADSRFYEVSGIIGISGEIEGCVVLNLTKEVALDLAGALLDETVVEVNEDCTDAIGELANMVAGSAKAEFPEGNTSLSVPSVVVGHHQTIYPSGIPILSIPCKTAKGDFTLDAALRQGG